MYRLNIAANNMSVYFAFAHAGFRVDVAGSSHHASARSDFARGKLSGTWSVEMILIRLELRSRLYYIYTINMFGVSFDRLLICVAKTKGAPCRGATARGPFALLNPLNIDQKPHEPFSLYVYMIIVRFDGIVGFWASDSTCTVPFASLAAIHSLCCVTNSTSATSLQCSAAWRWMNQ